MTKRRSAGTLLPLTPGMFQVLIALADGEKHGYAIIKEVARRTDGAVSLGAGTLYAIVRRFVREGVVAETAEVTARVVSVDPMSRRVTLQFVDGSTKTVRVNPDINLANVAPGDAVTVRITEALAIAVEKS